MSQSSQSVYEDPSESFDLKLNDSFNGTINLSLGKNVDEEYTSDFYNTVDHHKLNHNYNIWYSKLSKSQGSDDFESKLKIIGNFHTIEQFWTLFSWLKRPNEFEVLTEVNVFKAGIKPMWEHPANKNGGKFILKFKKGVISRLWESLLLAFLGEQFLVGDQINGVVLSIRHHFDALCIWNSNSKDEFVIQQIRDTLKKVLNLKDSFRIEYKAFNQPHQQPQTQQPQFQSNVSNPIP